MSNRYMHFTIGPVQSFVAQARRTRDYWAGSFLLSWLSAVAMNSAVHAQGQIVFPKPSREFLRAVSTGGTGPQQGLVPNRFICSLPDHVSPALIVDDVQAAWRQLAEGVWTADLASLGEDVISDQTRRLWEQQVGSFWEISWVETADLADAAALDRRKNIRTAFPPEAHGVKCSLMDGWQELSMASRPGEPALRTFWRRVRSAGGGLSTDIREGEHLCAISFVKRRFVRSFQSLSEVLPSGARVFGWTLPSGVPSVAYMASAHWVADIATRVDPPLLEQFMGAVKQAAADSEFGLASEANTRIECIDSACASAPDPRLARGFASLDAAAFFDAAQAPGTAFSRDEDSGRRLSNARREIEKAASIGDPKPYYALVAVDGDSVGSLLGDHAVRTSVAAAISSFADSAVEAVRHCNGFLIYAGGDDVLALLPSQDAFTCAVKLRSAYETAFADAGIPGASTLSAGIVYAHTGVSLGAVIAEAHRQLETVAKQQTGRDAVAVAVCKPGATTVEWSQPWHAALDADGRVVVEVLAHGLLNESEYTTTFLARFCDLVGMLQPPGSSSAALSAAEQDRLTAALLLGSSASLPGVPREVIEGRAAQLVSQCRIRHRETTASQPRISETGEIAVDAALLVRYLVSHGGESS